ncbi:flagellar motor switch protein FliN [Acidobacteria bacterium AB60]|nr:flagellar motor switch protein FliN [Acidobacteria bacterium AB60]
MTVDGAVRGECFVEFYRSEVAQLGSSLVGKPLAAFDQEHAEALTTAISSATIGLIAAVSPEHGLITIQVESANGIAPGAMRIVPLSATSEDGEPVSILLYFNTALVDGLSPQKPASKPPVEKQAPPAITQDGNLKLVMDVELNVTLRFGQRHLPLREVLELGSGSVIELDHQVDDPVELLLDGKVIARGEAVIVDGNYGLRVTEIPHPMTSQFTR